MFALIEVAMFMSFDRITNSKDVCSVDQFTGMPPRLKPPSIWMARSETPVIVQWMATADTFRRSRTVVTNPVPSPPGKQAVDLIPTRSASEVLDFKNIGEMPPRWRFGLVKHTKSTACKGEKVADRPDEGADLQFIG